MPSKKFLEEYPLYRRFNIDIPSSLNLISKVSINMYCNDCKSSQTFIMANEYSDGFPYSNSPSANAVVNLIYICSHCQGYYRYFIVKIDETCTSVMKIGQFPSWDIKGDPALEKMLGKYKDYYKKGLICESQAYGIGAYGYYRRIVESIIDELLDEIKCLLNGDDLKKYEDALIQTKKTIVTSEKINLVKDLLPPILRPDGMNPLDALHSILSEGLHAKSDEECMEYAETCRQVLTFLVNQIITSKETSKTFTEGMRRLLEKRSKQ